MRAIAYGTVIAESDETVDVEGNHYFPTDSIKWEFFTRSDSSSRCYWKGVASYYDIATDGGVIPDGAFIYERPLPMAKHITDRIAFWKGVEFSE